MLVPRALTAEAPISPDLFICDPIYGTQIRAEDCSIVGDDQLPYGADPVPYYIRGDTESHYLPFSITHGSCAIDVEIAGPDITGAASFEVAPDVIRGMAGYIINQCPGMAGGVGGFVTRGLGVYVNQLQNEDPLLDTFRAGTDLRFLTVTLTGPDHPLMGPGDSDPDIAIALGDLAGANLNRMWNEGVQSGDAFRRNNQAMGMFYNRGMDMGRGGDLTWWDPDPPDPPEANRMTYECYANLGSPAVVDCAHLGYEGLKPTGAADTIQFGPGITKVYTSNSCNLVISAANPITLAWSALQTAFETLVNICIEDPTLPSRGGRAFYGAKSLDAYSGKRIFGRAAASSSSTTGLNALPPGVNITVGSHADSTLLTCELKAAQQGKPVSTCGTG